MHTISDILQDISRGCVANNLNEDRFSYRIIFFVNENGIGTKYYVDSTYEGLRRSLENIIRRNLSLTNSVSVVQTTVRKDGNCVCLQSKSYLFSLDEYFQTIYGKRKKRSAHGKYASAI